MDDASVLLLLISATFSLCVLIVFFRACGRVRDIKAMLMLIHDLQPVEGQKGVFTKGNGK